MPLDFASQIPAYKKDDFIQINYMEAPRVQVFYQPNEQINLGTPEELEASQLYLEKSGKHSWFDATQAAALQTYWPDLPLKEHSSGKFYTATTALQEALNHKVLTPLDQSSLEDLSKEDIQRQENEITAQQTLLKTVAYQFDRSALPYQQLEQNYEGTDKKELLGTAYQAQIQAQASFKVLLGKQILELEEQCQMVHLALQDKSIPTVVKEATAQLESSKANINKQFELLEGDIHAIQVLPLSLVDWKKKIAELEQVPTVSKAAYIKTKEHFNEILRTYEQNNPSCLKEPIYINWKTAQVKANQAFEKGMVRNLKHFNEFVAQKKVPLAATGGDGKLEYRAGENQVTKQEQAKFGDKQSADVIFKSPKVPLYADGIRPEDVTQGGVGDCYLMAALMLLAEEDTKHLIEEMIEEQGEVYVVRLYSNDLPIEVEVDKKTLFLEYEDGYTQDMAASTKKELWVAIIEKAYAKYKTNIPPLKEQLELARAGNYDKKLPQEPSDYGGDYTAIEGSQTSLALEALVGNRVVEEEDIYLDEAGDISEAATSRAFSSRVALGKGATIAEEDLRDLLQASHKAGYKIGVDSPDTMEGVEGLTHDHLMEISAGVYMKFNHAYVVGGVEKQKVVLLDPHGDSNGKDKLFYSKILSQKIENLYSQLNFLEEELVNSNYDAFSMDIKNKITDSFLQLASYAPNTPIEKLENKWKRLIQRKELKEKNNKLIGLNYRAGTSFLEQLNKISTNLKQSDIGKGFWTREKEKIGGIQNITFSLLGKCFSSIRINKVKK
ncbi:MAG: C2 family cysteine protease [Aureispira sp.]